MSTVLLGGREMAKYVILTH